ncbi:hypothetical protein [Lysobacter capsici]|uniref:hypothetical protein n=1 Tax=Lysobacter capsici TaxID=435897 RepID=UPI00287B8300|nr:hypothetical protein [Lysobacter capsici]WND82620.1 hypothetical protein RJ610_09850 [Lysobacter capsici]WND87817.1 hypothetical protein RJ609_09855 [Lysobacter capsici]
MKSADVERLSDEELRSLLLSELSSEIDRLVLSQPRSERYIPATFLSLSYLSMLRSAHKKAGVMITLDDAAASDADFSHWARMPSWSGDEMAALLTGLDPRKAGENLKSLGDLAGESEKSKRFSDIRSILQRSDASSFIRPESYWHPLEAIKWAQQFEIDVPAPLHAAVNRMWTDSNSSPASIAQKPLRSDREETLLKVVQGLWHLAKLPQEPNTTADRLSRLFDQWEWTKPAKGTIADTVLTPASRLEKKIQS